MKNTCACSCTLVALCATAAFAAEPGTVDVRNFAQVDAHIFRGGAPTEAGLRELRAIHISIDLDLREPGRPEARERREAEQLGMKYINVGMPPLSAPTLGEMKSALAVLLAADAGSGRVFVHCRRGKDRTHGDRLLSYRARRLERSPGAPGGKEARDQLVRTGHAFLHQTFSADPDFGGGPELAQSSIRRLPTVSSFFQNSRRY
ncbi:MAG: fused DSP-PTPase phosphatase/NAD kinase-like protein [Bryobacteraceae bacterium]